MKRVLSLLAVTFLFGSTYAQDTKVTEEKATKENKIETIKIINGDTILHEVKVVICDPSECHKPDKMMRSDRFFDSELDEDLEEALEKMDVYINIDDNQKRMMVRRMQMHQKDIDELLESLDEGEDIILDMSEGRDKIKVIKIRINEDEGEEVEVIEKPAGRSKGRGPGRDDTRGPRGNHSMQGIRVFPNPASDEVNLEFNVVEGDPCKVVITDMNGKEIFNKTFTEEGQHAEKVRIDQDKKGVYFVTMQDGHRSVVKKIIIE